MFGAPESQHRDGPHACHSGQCPADAEVALCDIFPDSLSQRRLRPPAKVGAKPRDPTSPAPRAAPNSPGAAPVMSARLRDASLPRSLRLTQQPLSAALPTGLNL